jgi:hypoxanthine phosphoribosyltransferase
MEKIQVHDKVFQHYISKEDIENRINELAATINRDYSNKNPLFLGVLNGAFMFAADLFRKITIPAEICFIKLASYKGTKSTGEIHRAIGLDADIKGRDVIILEDIVDTGKTLSEFLPELALQQPGAVKIAALLYKPDATKFPVTIDYQGFVIPDKFVVGYGLDYDGYVRNLNVIYVEESQNWSRRS